MRLLRNKNGPNLRAIIKWKLNDLSLYEVRVVQKLTTHKPVQTTGWQKAGVMGCIHALPGSSLTNVVTMSQKIRVWSCTGNQ
jgi:hypothetical protein